MRFGNVSLSIISIVILKFSSVFFLISVLVMPKYIKVCWPFSEPQRPDFPGVLKLAAEGIDYSVFKEKQQRL